MSGVKSRLPLATCQQIQQLLEQKQSIASICARFGVNQATVYRLRHNFKHWDAFYPPPRTAGRRRSLDDVQERRLIEFLDDRPTAHLGEMAAWIFGEFGVAMSISGVWRVLQRQKWSRKKALERSTLEQSRILRDEFDRMMLPVSQGGALMFSDS